MLNCYIEIAEGGTIYKESVGAWVHSFFSKHYHDDGLAEYFNKSKAKAHSYFIDTESIQDGELLCISIRGIPLLEEKLKQQLSTVKQVQFGKVRGDVTLLDACDYPFKRMYTIQSPIIMREQRKVYRHQQPKKKTLDELLKESIQRKYELIYGEELPGLHSIHLHIDEVLNIPITIRGHSCLHKAYTGKVEIDATDEWLQFIQEVGLGNRTSYGFGAIG